VKKTLQKTAVMGKRGPPTEIREILIRFIYSAFGNKEWTIPDVLSEANKESPYPGGTQLRGRSRSVYNIVRQLGHEGIVRPVGRRPGGKRGNPAKIYRLDITRIDPETRIGYILMDLAQQVIIATASELDQHLSISGSEKILQKFLRRDPLVWGNPVIRAYAEIMEAAGLTQMNYGDVSSLRVIDFINRDGG
jgi:hypothetical protein